VLELAARANRGALQPVINASGIILHTNLGRAPLADIAVERIRQSAGFTNLEIDLESGKRSRRGDRVCHLLAELTGAEDAIVVNNCAAATVLVLQAVAFGREVIVSRGQLVEIGGGFRLPEVFASAGVILREVGTTNRTYLHDYAGALGEPTGAIIRVHRSNFSLSGFVTEPTIRELAELERPADVPFIDDAGSGLVTDLSSLGIREPTVLDSVSVGVDLCLFSGDKLFGGPQCGIIVGKRRWIERLRASPLMRAMRTDKLTLAALEATTEVHLSGEAWKVLPLFQMLSCKPEDVRQRCLVMKEQLGAAGDRLDICACVSQVGGGSLPGLEIPSFALSLRNDGERLASCLRLGRPAVQGRQVENQLLLDLRTVLDRELPSLRQRLSELLAASSASRAESI
jgi:L-seryl-tRNA(Ser) seleniumtransferase